MVLRLASLLWRLRRATLIETGLLQIQGDILRELRDVRQTSALSREQTWRYNRSDQPTHVRYEDPRLDESDGDISDCEVTMSATPPSSQTHETRLDTARCYLRLANSENGVFERLGRYETTLWRQARQVVFTLERLRWRNSSAKNRRSPYSWQQVDR